MIFQPVAQRWFRHVMCRADWYYGYGEAEIPALQMIYPDTQGRFQDEAGFNEYFRQPMLSPDAQEGALENDFWLQNDLTKWKFADGPKTISFLSQTVHDGTEPVVFVSHDHNGEWQFLGDSMTDGGGPVLSCLHHPIDKDQSLVELFDLPTGWYAKRRTIDDPWIRDELDQEEAK